MGYDKEWLAAGKSRSVTYDHLDPGKYTFMVKAAGSDGIWNHNPVTLDIHISRPFWATWWFKVGLLVLLVILGMEFYIRAIRGLRIQKRRLEELGGGSAKAADENGQSKPEAPKKKYSKSNLTWEQTEKYLKILLNFMETEKPYTESNLTIKILSEKVSIPQRSLSQVINEKLNQNFLDFINRYRVEEAKKQLISKDNRHNSILDIAFYVGFNSKSTFNTVFKKYVKMTPSKYKKKNMGQE